VRPNWLLTLNLLVFASSVVLVALATASLLNFFSELANPLRALIDVLFGQLSFRI
jgi:hypothetical protein